MPGRHRVAQGGNRKRYERLLGRFAQQQAQAVEAMRESLSSGDTATAERMAHSLKGAAGTLGAMAVSEWAAKAELAIQDGKDIDATLTSLSADLASSVQAIQAALAETASLGAADLVDDAVGHHVKCGVGGQFDEVGHCIDCLPDIGVADAKLLALNLLHFAIRAAEKRLSGAGEQELLRGVVVKIANAELEAIV